MVKAIPGHNDDTLLQYLQGLGHGHQIFDLIETIVGQFVHDASPCERQ